MQHAAPPLAGETVQRKIEVKLAEKQKEVREEKGN